MEKSSFWNSLLKLLCIHSNEKKYIEVVDLVNVVELEMPDPVIFTVKTNDSVKIPDSVKTDDSVKKDDSVEIPDPVIFKVNTQVDTEKKEDSVQQCE
jgi:hypothetical protein